MEAFSNNLRKWRALTGLTDAEIARRSGLGESRYANYVAGTREPDLGTLIRIARALGVTPNVLLDVAPNDEAGPALTRAHLALDALDPDDRDLAADLLETMVVRAMKRRGSR